jgi:hypothetical protein
LVGVADGGKRTASPVRSAFTHSICIWNFPGFLSLSMKPTPWLWLGSTRPMPCTRLPLLGRLGPEKVEEWPQGLLGEIERLLCAAAGGTRDADAPASARPRLGGISFLHRFIDRAILSPLIESKVNSIDSPGVVDAQKPGIVRGECVHPGNLRRRHPRNDRPVPRNSLKNQNG